MGNIFGSHGRADHSPGGHLFAEIMAAFLNVGGNLAVLEAEFPYRFPSLQQALSYAGLISQEFSRYANADSA